MAALAGVSKSTVSNVVRGADEVANATRERVLAAIERLNYTPNAIARQFVRQRTTTLGVLVGDLSDPYQAQLAQVVERAAFARGYTSMFCSIEGTDAVAHDGIEALLEHRVAGIAFLTWIAHTDRVDALLHQSEIPIVFVGLHDSWGDSVGPDDRAGGELATGHLFALGHRRIVYIRTGLVDKAGDGSRHLGYQRAMRLAGIPALPPYVWSPGADSVTIGRRTMTLDEAMRGPTAPSAAFVSNDRGAIAFIEACERMGVAVPSLLSVIGFDDIALAGLDRITLTTVARPLEFEARQAVGLLVSRIEDPGADARHERVPVTLRVRGSTAKGARAPVTA